MPSSSYGISVFSAGGSSVRGRPAVGVAERRSGRRPSPPSRLPAARRVPRPAARGCGAAATASWALPPASRRRRSSAARSRRRAALCQRSSGSFSRHFSHDVVERRRHHRRDRRDRRRLRREDRRDQARLRLALERAPRRRHLVEQRAEREDVGPRVGLRRPRAARAPCTGTCRAPSPRCVSGFASVGKRRRARGAAEPDAGAREAEVEELRAGLRQHHVAGLEVAVDDALLVRALRARRRPAPRTSRTWSSGSGPFCRRSASDSPSSSSITRKCASPSCPTSKSVQMCGWLSDEIVFASRSKRCAALRRSAAKPVGQDLDRDAAVEPRVLARARPRPCRRRRSAPEARTARAASRPGGT